MNKDIYTNHDYKYRILDHLSLTKEKTPETRDEMALDNGFLRAKMLSCFGAFGFHVQTSFLKYHQVLMLFQSCSLTSCFAFKHCDKQLLGKTSNLTKALAVR